ncbi:antitoxin [Actinomadura parmotrematis]|uniref:Antitoxin n=1 Tax=Actinomadura parmotrematis TaxID=2864039 RepID=A0ABS7G0P7_9ACTN|nr:antitoxin [Actinomadura parmotrematis]MBW8486284.1 antitoxin [Actinomadura parmotrematis]
MADLGGWADKAQDFAKDHPEQADKAFDKAGDYADERTGGKYGEQIDSGVGAAEDRLGVPRDASGAQDDQGDQNAQDEQGR